MSTIGATEQESIQRLQDFSSFVSCIKCYGRPIIPPLLVEENRNEIQRIRVAAAEKERQMQKKRAQLEILQNLEISEMNKMQVVLDECNFQEKSALWYPSLSDYQEGLSTAISKIPTSTIYSSVHTGAIVCSDLIENNHRYASSIPQNQSTNLDNSPTQCLECLNGNTNINCGLCQVEFDQKCNNFSSSESDICPEVPCRTFSLIQSSITITDDQDSNKDEAECESLPTVIFNDNAAQDTDNESSITCTTQSTDLDKYMDISCEFNHSENSVSNWESSKSVSQHSSVMSRSDDASSETVINTESELTPCASSLKKFSENIDELNIDEPESDLVNNDFNKNRMKRAHSIDSYMKILQTGAEMTNIKKSSSDPLDSNIKIASISFDIKTTSSFKTSQLIKEDSKESDESKDLAVKDVSTNNNKESPSKSTENDYLLLDVNSHKKKLVRRNSYTLEHPSPVLLFAHRDCSCSLTSDSISPPHCTALEHGSSISAFMKEKVEIIIPVSVQDKYPILNLNPVTENSPIDELTPPVDVFPLLQENTPNKSDSANLNVSEKDDVSENPSVSDLSPPKSEHIKDLNERFTELQLSESNLNEEHVKQIYEELHKQHEIRLKELLDEQQRQWEKVQNEWIEQEKLIYSKMLIKIAPEIADTENPILEKTDSAHEKEFFSDVTLSTSDDRASTQCSSNKESMHSLESSSNQDQISNISSFHTLSYPCFSEPPQTQSEVLLTSTNEHEKSFDASSRASSETTNATLINNNSNISLTFPYDSSEDHFSYTSDSVYNGDKFPTNSAVLLPQCETENLPSAVCVDNQFNAYREKSPLYPSYEYRNGNNQYEIYHSNHSSLYSEKNCNLCVIGTQVPCFTNNLSSNTNSTDVHISKSMGCSRKLKFDELPSKQTSLKNCPKKAQSLSSPDILQLPNATNNVATQLIFKDKPKVPLGNIISFGAKHLKNGYCPKREASLQYVRTEITPLIAKKLKRLPALVKGYLTRRLLNTERLQNLYKTIEDSYILLANLSDELKLKGENVSENDLNLRTQLFNQLMSAFYERYDICINKSIKEQMRIISDSRNFRLKQKLIESKHIPVTTQASSEDASNGCKLSSATLKALERKKKSNIDSRTYTIKDFKNFRARSAVDRTYTIEDLKKSIKRPCSQMFSKSRTGSPASIYKVSVGRLSPKRKTASSKSLVSRHSVQVKSWVP